MIQANYDFKFPHKNIMIVQTSKWKQYFCLSDHLKVYDKKSDPSSNQLTV